MKKRIVNKISFCKIYAFILQFSSFFHEKSHPGNFSISQNLWIHENLFIFESTVPTTPRLSRSLDKNADHSGSFFLFSAQRNAG